MKHWSIEQLRTYIIANRGQPDDPHPILKPKHYRLLLLGTARRLSASKNK